MPIGAHIPHLGHAPGGVPCGALVDQLLERDGAAYVFGAENDPRDPAPDETDCSECLEWACARLGVRPRLPDGSWIQYRHCLDAGLGIATARALRTRGALLFVFDGDPLEGPRPARAHVAASLGNGYTVEARSARYGVGVFAPRGGWTHAALIPGVSYQPFWRCARGDVGGDVRMLQELLGVTPDGNFGPVTELAVRAAQRRLGLDVTGRADPALRAGFGA